MRQLSRNFAHLSRGLTDQIALKIGSHSKASSELHFHVSRCTVQPRTADTLSVRRLPGGHVIHLKISKLFPFSHPPHVFAAGFLVRSSSHYFFGNGNTSKCLSLESGPAKMVLISIYTIGPDLTNWLRIGPLTMQSGWPQQP